MDDDQTTGPERSARAPQSRWRRLPPLNALRAFEASARHGSFTRAAGELFVTPAAVSHQVKALEDFLGLELFRRERNLTHLTDFGRLIRPYLEEIQSRTSAAQSAAHDFLYLEKAPLNIGIMVTIGPLRFTRFLSEFQRDHPGIELWLREGTLEELSEKLMSGTLDLAVMGLPGELGGRFDAINLYAERYVAIFPRGHRYEAANRVPFSDLVREPYIDRLSCEARPQILKQWEEQRAELVCAHRSHRDDWVQGLVLAGFGIAVMPEYSISAIGLRADVQALGSARWSFISQNGQRW